MRSPKRSDSRWTVADDDWPLWPHDLFETRRRARRRLEEFKARVAMRYEVWTMPDRQSVATLRAQRRPSKNVEEPRDQP